MHARRMTAAMVNIVIARIIATVTAAAVGATEARLRSQGPSLAMGFFLSNFSAARTPGNEVPATVGRRACGPTGRDASGGSGECEIVRADVAVVPPRQQFYPLQVIVGFMASLGILLDTDNGGLPEAVARLFGDGATCASGGILDSWERGDDVVCVLEVQVRANSAEDAPAVAARARRAELFEKSALHGGMLVQCGQEGVVVHFGRSVGRVFGAFNSLRHGSRGRRSWSEVREVLCARRRESELKARVVASCFVGLLVWQRAAVRLQRRWRLVQARLDEQRREREVVAALESARAVLRACRSWRKAAAAGSGQCSAARADRAVGAVARMRHQKECRSAESDRGAAGRRRRGGPSRGGGRQRRRRRARRAGSEGGPSGSTGEELRDDAVRRFVEAAAACGIRVSSAAGEEADVCGMWIRAMDAWLL
jgi:hypothetical protein